MAGPNWAYDPDTPQTAANIAALVPEVAAHAMSGAMPAMDTAKEWHAKMLAGEAIPSPQYAGNYRGDTTLSDLIDAEVRIGSMPGTRSYLVYGEVEQAIIWLCAEILTLDVGGLDQLDADMRALELAGEMHGRWIRIHPFVNGNGRTARLWVLWILARYAIPPLLPIRPRPNPPYASASKLSMTGDDGEITLLLKQLYALLP